MTASYIFLACAILATAFGQFFYKKFAMTKMRKYYIATIGLFVLTPVCSFLALKHIPIDTVYVFTALTIFIVIILSKVFLKEHINVQTYRGVFLIILGVVIYAY